MTEYPKKHMDAMYRLISLNSSQNPNYVSIEDQSIIQVQEDQVLEIKSQDGTERLWTGERKKTLRIEMKGKFLHIPKKVPLNRLWLCAKGKKTRYKIPLDLPVENEHHVVLVPEGTHQVTVVGDRYFRERYDF